MVSFPQKLVVAHTSETRDSVLNRNKIKQANSEVKNFARVTGQNWDLNLGFLTLNSGRAQFWQGGSGVVSLRDEGVDDGERSQ